MDIGHINLTGGLVTRNPPKNQPSVTVNGLCQLTVCFEFQSRSETTKGHKECALQMVFRST